MEIKSVQATNLVQKLEKSIKRKVINYKCDIPQQFLEKRNYMQSDEFLKDPHNVKMFEYGEQLADLRDKIGLDIIERNKTSRDEIVQGINGFSRVKKYLDINPKMNYSEIPSFHTPLESAYWCLRQFKIGNTVREAKNKLSL